MKKFLPMLIVFLAISLILGGCAKNQSGDDGKITLEVAVFQGGYGLDFFEYAAREYEKLNPDVKINVWGNPRVWEQLRPRFVAGDPPDLSWPGWGMDYWALVMEGKVLAMDDYLEENAYDQDIKWKDTFMPSLLEKGMYEGSYYIMPFNHNVFGWWYNASMFEKNGWEPPQTFEELLVLCEKIKQAGIAPITYQGKYPTYMVRGFLLPWAISVGGFEVFVEAQNLEPGAWNSPAFLKAAEMIAELRDKGYFQRGAMGMDHTGSQMEFILGRAAMIPCGTWLGSEMKNQMPEGFEMDFMNPPYVKDGKGDPSITSTGAETWIIPSEGKHPEIAVDFYRFMTSLAMSKQFVTQKNTLMSIIGSDDVEIGKDLQTPAKLIREASITWDADFAKWYPTFGKAVESAMAALLNGQMTPKQAVDAMEQAAARIRNDDNIPKHRMAY